MSEGAGVRHSDTSSFHLPATGTGITNKLGPQLPYTDFLDKYAEVGSFLDTARGYSQIPPPHIFGGMGGREREKGQRRVNLVTHSLSLHLFILGLA